MAHTSGSTSSRSPETVDRLMVGVCGAIWLVWLAVSAIAVVALVELGSGHPAGGSGSGSSWLLYTIIVISALVIIGAVPLLLRARRMSEAAAAAAGPKEAEPLAPLRTAEAPTEKLRVFGSTVDPYRRESQSPRQISRIDAVLQRVWLRGTASLLGAMGLALTAVAVATYLLATHTETAAWVVLGVAGVITVGMPLIFRWFLQQVDSAPESALAVDR